ncbi:DUF502 domain-containing protein [Sphingobacterium psychroaquaticum]|uniref:Uncharacterized membrane protein n=1 Tax=Sphingobacterium psychroaquaticum TaxID=561061 RepID=A0A1X7IIC8_9SPHI|nr:DUF502 domain-containing protein [Sphingobacterium psychroaquaticum]QBQ41521.1 DUF502 domain-containing protein [Sphingobacterium psychroaquaticum]SMG14189.1 Uncharacterized membrane protein [Sphingobacterium psychroaquaticum]
MIKKVAQKLFYYFIKGTLVVVPVAGAIFLIGWIFASLDNALNLTTHFLQDEEGHPLYIPGIGILTILVTLIIVGAIFTNLVTAPIRAWFQRTINKIPLFNTLYSSIKDFTEAFVGDAKKFNEPVLVLVNETGLKKVGFLTQRDLSKIGLTDEVVVYFPYSYSVAGQVVVVKAIHVEKLKMSATDAMKLVVSGGVSGID